jgi:hypothetical protein
MVPLSLATVWPMVSVLPPPLGAMQWNTPAGRRLPSCVAKGIQDITERLIPEAQWSRHATSMVRELTDKAHVDSGLVAWIIRR